MFEIFLLFLIILIFSPKKKEKKMNILHFVYYINQSLKFVVAKYKANKVESIQWHNIDDQEIIGPKLDWSQDDLSFLKEMVEENILPELNN
jgi:hypothetical protein